MHNSFKDCERILKSAYIDLVNRELQKPINIRTEPVRCRHCGRRNVTLRKCSDGLYICNDCLGKGDK